MVDSCSNCFLEGLTYSITTTEDVISPTLNWVNKSIRSEVDILGHFGTLWDNSEYLMMSLEHF